MVFSDNPNTLKHIIDSALAGQTLNYNEHFDAFNKKFEKESSLYVYANIPLLFDTFYASADATTKIGMKKNKDFLICFPLAGFQLTPKNNLFESRLVLDYLDVDEVKQNEFYVKRAVKSNHQPIARLPQKITEKVFDLPPIYPNDLNADSFVKKFASGSIKYEVKLKDGKKHGRYLEFYSNGAKKISGRFRHDNQVGTWRYYDIQGILLLKKRY